MKWRERKPILSDELARLGGLEPHELLGVAADASLEDITAEYRRLIKVYHPDRSDPFMKQHNQAVTRLIIEAYKQLVALRRGRP